MIIVTGGEGFIGKNLISRLNDEGYLSKDKSYVDLNYNESLETNSFENHEHIVVSLDTKSSTLNEIFNFMMRHGRFIKAVFHLGAITDTTILDRNLFDEYNVTASIYIWTICTTYQIPLIYASSAATYGDGSNGFDDEMSIKNLKPLNPYGWSKQQVDEWALEQTHKPPFWCGLKFFNVFGEGEAPKGKMASMIFQLYNQLRDTGHVRLFKSHHPDYKDGDQLRDFIYVKDVVDICIWMYENKPESGIYNVGTGKARTFNDIVYHLFYRKRVSDAYTEYFDVPETIRDKYQYFTEAKISKLRNAGYSKPFWEMENGIYDYVSILEEKIPGKIRLHTYGDSHAYYGWNIPVIGLPFTDIIRNVLGGPTTMSRIAFEKLDYFNTGGTALKDDEAVCFCFGEIDCRMHLAKPENFPIHQELINEIVPNYIKAMAMNAEQYKNLKVIIFNVVPTVRLGSNEKNSVHGHEGTDEQRKTVTLYMNAKLKEYCEKYGFIFFDVYDKYCDEDGYINPELSNDIHIKNNIYMIEFLKNLKIF